MRSRTINSMVHLNSIIINNYNQVRKLEIGKVSRKYYKI